MSDGIDSRPCLTPAVEALIAGFIDVTPALMGLVATEILVVALGAHGTAVASVREFVGQAASVQIAKRRRRIELGLRPDFFFVGDAARRAATIMHELLHLDPARPGRLLEAHRHANRSHKLHEREAQTLTRAALQALPPTSTLCLAHDGEVRLRAWRHRPIDTTASRRFGDVDVYDAVITMQTPADRRGGWW